MCDTFVALPTVTEDRSVILAKNSDREANEMQSLEYFEGVTYSMGEKLKCTYIEIDQVEKTNAILICRPFWMWGAEMGTNDKGVAIGNEAIWTKMPVHKENNRLLGMDLLRLALERADTAKNALDVICNLIELYGQGGIAGYKNKSMSYHNSFLIADKNEAWVLETADFLWVAKKVKHYYSISNGTTIGEYYDLAHPELIATAIKKGWHKKGDKFNFSKSYSDWLYTTFSASKTRQNQTVCQLENNLKKINVLSSIKSLQSHFKDDYLPDSHLLSNSICAHAGNSLTRNASQTTGSMVAHLADNTTSWFTATASACTSIFKPVWFNGNVLPPLGNQSATFIDGNFWWENEKLHRTIIQDYKRLKSVIMDSLETFQLDILSKANTIIDDDKYDFTCKVFYESSKKTQEWISTINARKNKSNWIYRNYWKKLNKEADIDI